jgi:hypothetical protein
MDSDDAARLAEKMLAAELPRRWRHVRSVARRAKLAAPGLAAPGLTLPRHAKPCPASPCLTLPGQARPRRASPGPPSVGARDSNPGVCQQRIGALCARRW